MYFRPFVIFSILYCLNLTDSLRWFCRTEQVQLDDVPGFPVCPDHILNTVAVVFGMYKNYTLYDVQYAQKWCEKP